MALKATPRRVPQGVQVIHYSMPDGNGMSNTFESAMEAAPHSADHYADR